MSSQRLEAPLPFDYRIVRSHRRTAAIQIRADAVEVRVPHWVGADWIDGFVRSREQWIRSRLASVRAQRDAHLIEVARGARVPFRGQALRLDWQPGAAAAVAHRDDRLEVTLSRRIRRPQEEVVADQLRQWLQRQATDILCARLWALAAHTGLQPSGVSVRGFRRRWGSCDSRGRIALNWRLVLAHPEAADYVLIHELCHLRHFDHSPRFWQLVARHCAGYRQHQDYFRERACWLEW
ncbi:M48 family metallopeptidase [Marinobacterium aestuariivivens]|uniref:M48 family metallopeptidase n=1 Tax=Marinobacterium aestuariivivens TaxID=1698799 RepID=A0ABW2A8V8_9GAMM